MISFIASFLYEGMPPGALGLDREGLKTLDGLDT